MKTFLRFVAFAVFVAATGCKKDTTTTNEQVLTKFPPPNWQADDSGQYPASMTAVVAISSLLQKDAGENDEMAAFVNGECRGVGVVVKVGDNDEYFVLIHGTADEQSKVTFKYYSAKTSYLYQTDSSLNFMIDAVYGTAQNPVLLALNQVK